MRLRAAEHATEIAEGCQMRRGGRRQPRVPITVYGCCIIKVMNEHWLPDWRSYDNRSDRACYEGVRTRKLLFFDALHLRRHQGLASKMRQPNRKPATRYCAPSSGGRAGAASGTGACGAVAADSSAPVESKIEIDDRSKKPDRYRRYLCTPQGPDHATAVPPRRDADGGASGGAARCFADTGPRGFGTAGRSWI